MKYQYTCLYMFTKTYHICAIVKTIRNNEKLKMLNCSTINTTWPCVVVFLYEIWASSSTTNLTMCTGLYNYVVLCLPVSNKPRLKNGSYSHKSCFVSCLHWDGWRGQSAVFKKMDNRFLRYACGIEAYVVYWQM